MEDLGILIIVSSLTYLIYQSTLLVKKLIDKMRVFTKILNDKELFSEYERIVFRKMSENLSIEQIESIKKESIKELKESKLNQE